MDSWSECIKFRRRSSFGNRNPVKTQQLESDVVKANEVGVVSDGKEGVRDAVDSGYSAESCGRERLKRHKAEVAGQVWIPEIWGQEELLKDWIDSSAFDSALVPTGIMSARAALVQDCRKAANPGGFPIDLGKFEKNLPTHL